MPKQRQPERMVQPCRSVNTPGAAAKFIESILGAYDPDKDYALKSIKNPVVSFFERATRAPKRNATDQEIRAIKREQKELIERANIIEVNRMGVLRVRSLNNTLEFQEAYREARDPKNVATLHKIVESGIKFQDEKRLGKARIAELRKLGTEEKFRENWADSNENTYDEYVPIMGGPWSHQLYLHDYLDMMAKTFEAFNHNPYAHRAILLKTFFTLGRGVTFKAKDPDVQDKFKAWWEKQDMDGRLEAWDTMLSRDGELLVRKFRNPSSGEFFLRWISASTIWEIVTDIEDIEQVFYYHQQYPAAYQVLYGAPAGSKFNPDQYESSRYIINQIPADEVYHIKINVGPDEKRGRSDLFNVLGDLKRHKDHKTGVTLKAIVQSVFAWKNKLAGTNTDVNAYIAQFGTSVPDFGSIHVENEASDLQPMTADSKSGGNIQDAPQLVTSICVGMGLSPEYMGGTGGASHGGSSKATAVVGSEPSIKMFQGRQLLLGRLLKCIANDWAQNEGIAEHGIEFEFPEIAIEDRSAKIKDLQAALQDEVLDHESYCVSVAKELGNHDYNYKTTQSKIDSDKATGRGVSDIYGLGRLPAPVPPVGTVPPGAPGAAPGSQPPAAPAAPQPKKQGPSSLSGKERSNIKKAGSSI